MIDRFPRQRAFLERTRLRYVRLESILHDGKVDRAARVPGFVVLFLGEELGLIFLDGGEPVSAARLRPKQREVVSIQWLVARAEREAERGDVAYYGAPAAQLRAMYATVSGEPVLRPGAAELARPGQLLSRLAAESFSGVLEVRDGGAVHYLGLSAGAVEDVFLAGAPAGEPVREGLERLFLAGDPARLAVTGYPAAETLPVQASAALAELYRTVVAAALEETGRRMGEQPALLCFRSGLERARARFPELRMVEVGGKGEILGGGTGTAERLTAGIAHWLFEALSVASRRPEVDPMEVLATVARPHRHALEAQGFFRRLPWPIPA